MQVRKPMTGELRGLKLIDLMQVDTNAMLELLPRVTQPILDVQLLNGEVDSSDFLEMASTVLLFLKPEVAA